MGNDVVGTAPNCLLFPATPIHYGVDVNDTQIRESDGPVNQVPDFPYCTNVLLGLPALNDAGKTSWNLVGYQHVLSLSIVECDVKVLLDVFGMYNLRNK